MVEAHLGVWVEFGSQDAAARFCAGMVYALGRDYEEPDRKDYSDYFRRGVRFAHLVEIYARKHHLPVFRLPVLFMETRKPGETRWQRKMLREFR